jgi:hypothetical protein
MTQKNPLAKKSKASIAKVNKSGRPSVLTPDTIAKLEVAFICSATDQEACVFAGIHPSSLYRYLERFPEYRERIQGLKGMVKLLAKLTIYRELEKGNLAVAWEVLERGRVEGYQKVSASGAPGVQVNIVPPGETPEGRAAIQVLHAILSGKALPGPE